MDELEKIELRMVEDKYITLDDLLVVYRGNQTKVAEVSGINRGTLRKYIENRYIYDVKLFMVNDELRPYVFGRANGRHKKGNK